MQLATPLTTLNAADTRIRQLGDAMYEMLADRGECTRALLRAEGFSTHELDTYGDAARTYANARFVRQIEPEGFTRSDDEIVEIAVDAGLGLVGDAQIATAALARGLTPQQIARVWPRILRKLAVRLATLPTPQVA
jgi:hypothetical protein